LKNDQKLSEQNSLTFPSRAVFRSALVLVAVLFSAATIARADTPLPTMDYSYDGIDTATDANGNPERYASAATGEQGKALNSYKTNEAPGSLPVHRSANPTMKQTPGGLPITQWTILDKQHHNQDVRSLPTTYLDSLIQASGPSEAIYGDEGTDDIPPYFTFTPDHYIGTGLDSSEPDLTTLHKAALPSAWGWTMKP
jgi:hypothetical protein